MAFFAKCTACWRCKGYFDEEVIAVVCIRRAEESSAGRPCPVETIEKGGWCSALFSELCCLCHQSCCQPVKMVVLCALFFPLEIFFLILLKVQIKKCLCLTSAPSNSAGAFAVSYCRGWCLHWKELWQCHFMAFAALISVLFLAYSWEVESLFSLLPLG